MAPHGARRRRWATPDSARRAALVLVVALTSACTSTIDRAGHRAPHTGTTEPVTSASSTSTTLPPAPPVTPVVWTPCQNGLQCGTVAVPLDYAHPTGAQIQIALARRPALDPGALIGSLVINPGGPGGSGVDDLPAELRVLTAGLLDDFDIVSFDPRGVDRSDPVTCGETGGPATQGLLPDPAPQSVAAQQAVQANDRAYAAQCEKASGPELPFVGTVDAARDLDRIRAALGDAQLTYFGHSYGTLLGLTYADLFPTHVRAMVLDGVIDPALSTYQMLVDQAQGFEAMLQSFFSWCAGSASCAWHPVGDPTAALLAIIDKARQAPIPAGAGRQAGPGEIYTAVLSSLYNSSAWGSLAAGLAGAAAGNASGLVAKSDQYDTENGPNSADANTSISCLDHPVPHDLSAFAAMAAAAAGPAPVFGPMLVWDVAECSVWPAAPTRTPHPISAPGAPPILVVGTSGDPATPHQWAVAVAGELQHGVLVTWDGQNHVAYYYSPCVRSIDQAYLLGGTLPANGTTCTD
ncbi:MAG TPA: alpha/beta hydrolase [Acidimicrobiales bacterium]|nr:alpha/beta hydrolase [Acidimicrobiales bacterium]